MLLTGGTSGPENTHIKSRMVDQLVLHLVWDVFGAFSNALMQC